MRTALFYLVLLLALSAMTKGSHALYDITIKPPAGSGAPVRVYFLWLPEVGSSIGGNLTSVFEGVRDAVGTNRTVSFQLDPTTYTEGVWLNTTFVIVRAWDEYRKLVESGSNLVLINAHDEYLPVPQGVSREEWIDRIADFMGNRYGTWVHLGGYPISHTWPQDGSPNEWGPDGFRRLMSHTGWDNATLYPPPNAQFGQMQLWQRESGSDWWDRDYVTRQRIGIRFSDFDAYYTDPGFPIQGTKFTEDFIWWRLYLGGLGTDNTWYSAGALKFRLSNSADFGGYVHLSVSRFQTAGFAPFAKGDYARGALSTLLAFYSLIINPQAVIFSAQQVIDLRQYFGKTVGLIEARGLLEQGKAEYHSGNYLKSASVAFHAEEVASKASVPPSPLPMVLYTIGAVAAVSGGAIALRTRRARRRTESKPPAPGWSGD